MPQVKKVRSRNEDARDMPPAAVQHWRIHSTSLNVAIHLHANGYPSAPGASSQRGFVLEVEQARQMIRDLSAAVLALDLQRFIE
jgi:hypothetical protein